MRVVLLILSASIPFVYNEPAYKPRPRTLSTPQTWACIGPGLDSFRCIHDMQHAQQLCAPLIKNYTSCVHRDNGGGNLLKNAEWGEGSQDYHRLIAGRYGWMVTNPFDIYLALSIELYGEWSQNEMERMSRFLSPADHVLDIGGHLGSLTMAFARFVGPLGSVTAFEPQYEVFRLNIVQQTLNGMNNVRTRNAYVSHTAGTLWTPRRDHTQFGNYGGALTNDTSLPGDHVPVLTVDGMDVAAVQLIKIDVEGMELDVLKGARLTLERFKPTVYLEDNELLDSGGSIGLDYYPDTAKFLHTFGYRCWLDHQPYFNPDNYKGESFDIFRSGHSSLQSKMILCVHPSRFPDVAADVRMAYIPNPRDTSEVIDMFELMTTTGPVQLKSVSMVNVEATAFGAGRACQEALGSTARPLCNYRKSRGFGDCDALCSNLEFFREDRRPWPTLVEPAEEWIHFNLTYRAPARHQYRQLALVGNFDETCMFNGNSLISPNFGWVTPQNKELGSSSKLAALCVLHVVPPQPQQAQATTYPS